MNRRPSGSLFLSRAIVGFLQYKAAEGLSPNTLCSYEGHLKLWLEYTGDIPVKQIDAKVVQEYFVWLRMEFTAPDNPADMFPICMNFNGLGKVFLNGVLVGEQRERDLVVERRVDPEGP